MSNHFSALGFRVTDEEGFHKLVQQAANAGRSMPTPRGEYLRWAPGAGVELWIQVNRQRELTGCNPHFAGEARMEVQGVKTLPGDSETLDGSLYAWAAPQGEEPESGAYPFVVDLPDFDLVAGHLVLP